MAKTSPLGIWLMRLTFIAIALIIIFVQLLPLNTTPSRWAPPNLILMLAFAWSVRRPDFVPALLITIIMLIADFLLQRAPGLWALLTLLACEFLKSRVAPHREITFMTEWSAVAIVVIGITLLNRFILGIMAVEQAHVTLDIIQIVMNLLAYPVVVAFSKTILGVRRLSAAEIEAKGGHN